MKLKIIILKKIMKIWLKKQVKYIHTKQPLFNLNFLFLIIIFMNKNVK